jgi:hypothetical protein
MAYDAKNSLGKYYPTLRIVLGHWMRNPPEIAFPETTMFAEDAQASCLRDATLLTHALSWNKRIFLDKGSH